MVRRLSLFILLCPAAPHAVCLCLPDTDTHQCSLVFISCLSSFLSLCSVSFWPLPDLVRLWSFCGLRNLTSSVIDPFANCHRSGFVIGISELVPRKQTWPLEGRFSDLADCFRKCWARLSISEDRTFALS